MNEIVSTVTIPLYKFDGMRDRIKELYDQVERIERDLMEIYTLDSKELHVRANSLRQSRDESIARQMMMTGKL